MTAKLLTIVVTFGLIALGLLSQRQHRLDMAFRITKLHQQCDLSRTKLWNIRSHITEELARQKIRSREAMAIGPEDGPPGSPPGGQGG